MLLCRDICTKCCSTFLLYSTFEDNNRVIKVQQSSRKRQYLPYGSVNSQESKNLNEPINN